MTALVALPTSGNLAPAEVEAWCQEVDQFIIEETDLQQLNNLRARFEPFEAAWRKASQAGSAAIAATSRRMEIRLGELMSDARAAGEMAGHGRPPAEKVQGCTFMTVDDLGITKRDAAEFVAMAENPDVVEHVIAQSTDERPATRNAVREAIKEKRRAQSNVHPATFSNAIIDAIVDALEGAEITRIIDPFAGTGLVHRIADRLMVDSVGVEIEHEWASMHERTICADSTTITADDVGSFDCVVTSPTYGNRMADKHNAQDESDRATYRHRLGRDLSPNNTGGIQWTDRAYRDLHLEVYRRVVDMLPVGGYFVLNVKDHVRNGARQPVSWWHLKALEALGLESLDDAGFGSRGLGGSAGENADTRNGVEHIFILRKDHE